MALADLLGRIDPLTVEGGGHSDVGDQDVGLMLQRTLDDLVVVGRHSHDREVGVAGDQRAYAFTHDQVVVGQEDVDRAGRPG
jgi:hypothetical protein